MNQQHIQEISDIINSMKIYCQLKDRKIAKSMNFSCSELNCLKQYFKVSSLSVKDIAERLGITSGAVTRIVASLEKSGILRRDIDLNDRRGINVKLTKSGIEKIAQLKQINLEYCTGIFQDIKDEKTKLVLEGLLTLNSAWSEKISKDRHDYSELAEEDEKIENNK